eukprot:Gb_02467 [translate_table: standard]
MAGVKKGCVQVWRKYQRVPETDRGNDPRKETIHKQTRLEESSGTQATNRKSKNVSILGNSSNSCLSDCQQKGHCPNSVVKHRLFSPPKIAEAWWVPPREEEKISIAEKIHEEEILPATISEELPPLSIVDTSTTEEDFTFTESKHEDDNGYMVTKYNDEVMEYDDKVVRKNPGANSSEAIQEVEVVRKDKATRNDKVAEHNNQATGNDKEGKVATVEDDETTRYDDEAAGETTGTSSLENGSESFTESQPMMSKVQKCKEKVQTLEILSPNTEAHTIKILAKPLVLDQMNHLVCESISAKTSKTTTYLVNTGCTRSFIQSYIWLRDFWEKVDPHGMNEFGYAPGNNVLCAELERKMLWSYMHNFLYGIPSLERFLPVPITDSVLLESQLSQIVSIPRPDCTAIQGHGNSSKMEKDNNLQAIKSNEENDMFEEIDKSYKEQDAANRQNRKQWKETYDFAGLNLSTLAMREENDMEEQLEDISAVLVENNCFSKSLMALYRRDSHVKSLVQIHAEKLKCIWQHSVPLLRCLSNSFASQYETLSEELDDEDNIDDAVSQCFKENLLLPNPTLLQWEHSQILQKKGIQFDGLSQSYHHLLVTKQRDYFRCTAKNKEDVLEVSYLHQLPDFNNEGTMGTIP